MHLNPLFQHSAQTNAQLLAHKDRQLAALTAALTHNTKPACLFSFETLTHGNKRRGQNFADYCRQFTAEVQVIVYVRSPIAYMQSEFASQVKGCLICAACPC